MTTDCEHITERKKAKTQMPGVITQHTSYFCLHVPPLYVNESHQAWSERDRNASITVLKQEPSISALFLMLKKVWSASILHHRTPRGN